MSSKNLTLADYCYVNPSKWLPEGIAYIDLVSFIPMSDVTGNGHWNIQQVRKLIEVDSGFTTFKNKDVLVAKITPCFENGKGALVDNLTGDVGFGSTEFHVLRAKDTTEPRFIFHISQWKRFRVSALKFMSGSAGQQRVSSEFFYKFKVGRFSKAEQELISDMLDLLDSQVRKTETIIAKLQQVKQGLLHDLLTRGVDENGELRPNCKDAPELYKPSELGWIPKSWEVECLSDLSESGLMNGVFKEPSRVGKGIPLVNVADLYKGEEVNLNTCELFDATEIEKERYDVKKGDIFFTRSSLKLEGIAHTSFINCDCESVVFECHVMRLRPNPKKIIPLLLKEWCVGPFARKHFMANAKQVTMTTISQDGIRNLPCPKPFIEEQSLIEKVICGFEERVTKEISLLTKLKDEKSGLMDDLLTAKICVTDLIKQAKVS